uniref:Uncharacterized protein n=1 Tax=Chlamydomonas euryale TaxID=1486919 RepID=A0A7R9VM98_9CHLO
MLLLLLPIMLLLLLLLPVLLLLLVTKVVLGAVMLVSRRGRPVSPGWHTWGIPRRLPRRRAGLLPEVLRLLGMIHAVLVGVGIVVPLELPVCIFCCPRQTK